MQLAPRTHVRAYEIIGAIGVRGMGEVEKRRGLPLDEALAIARQIAGALETGAASSTAI